MNDSNYRIVWLVRRLFRALAERSNDMLADRGITSADRAVMEFLYPDEALTVPQIASRYQVSRQHVQTTINPLIECGLLVTRKNPRHKRSPCISLSPQGRKLFTSIRRADIRAVDRVFRNIPQQDRDVTAATLETLLQALKETEK